MDDGMLFAIQLRVPTSKPHALSHNAAWLERAKVALKAYWRLAAFGNPVASASLRASPGGCRHS